MRWLILLLCLLCLAGAWLFWHQPANPRTKPSAPPKVAAPAVPAVPAVTASKILTPVYVNSAKPGTVLASTNPFAYRLSNTTRTIGQLVNDSHAILLENALIDTRSPLNFSIPTHLQSQGDPGAYIVQACGPIDNAFRAMLAAAGAEIVAYIPNDAYLVRAPAGVANGLAGNPLTQAVIPYEPYYKISSSMPVTVAQKSFSAAPMKTNRAAGPSLLVLAMKQAPLPAGTHLTLGLFKDGAAGTVTQIEKLGGQIVARDNSPFGPVVRVQPPRDWTALATLPGVQIVEPYHKRIHANDLSRVTTGVAADTLVSSNYMNLSGSNVMVEVNDSGIDATHPDFSNGGGSPVRVLGDPANLVDTSGHGTHVAGIIAGDGFESTTVTNAQGSIMPGTNGQFRGKAPLAHLLSMDWNLSDKELQEEAALTNALISNNSWNYGDTAYDLAAASYDAAVRDALPEVTGSQPVLFVFSAGNSGGGGNDGGGGNADTVLSPATAKNVITVGALEQLRSITNMVTDRNSNSAAVWQPWTDTSFQVAGNSSRGNVGVGTEGANGRFKPDVVAPGSFVISTRSGQWDEIGYYSPTNYHLSVLTDQFGSGSENFYSLLVPSNVVQIVIGLFANISSPVPFPSLPIYIWNGTDPRVSPPYLVESNFVSIPPDSTLGPVGAGWSYAVSNNTSGTVSYDLLVEIVTTNDAGNYFQVLSNLNNSLGGDPDSLVPPHYYRYESGTSMSAADVSGVLALIQDYFTNTLHATPSPALLKALLINGARLGVDYTYEIQNALNFQGWGLVNLPDSLPLGMTNQLNAACASFFVDQSPTNALATGDSHTYSVSIPDGSDGQLLPLRITLTWTDPPGDPAAAIKLVNSLELVVSNADTGDVFIGNDIASGNTYNQPWDTNLPPNIDSINNVQNVFIPPLLGTQYSITVIGRSVNVNAVTAHTNNVVQDYALVISSGNGEVTNAFTVTDNPIVSNPTTDQQITYVVNPNGPLMNQLAGASTPLLGTNTIRLTTNGTELNGIQLIGTNGMVATNIITLGMTNQWHFYVVTNTGAADFTNAAFITFIPDTLSIPRMGVFEDSVDNATRPEADIDLYVSSNPGLMNLDPNVLSTADKSVGRGGTEFVYYINSAPGKVYYVGVYSEDQEASEYGFIPIFTNIPFSQMNTNGSQVVNGLTLPANIPDGSPAHPGYRYVFSLALYPMQVLRVIVTNTIAHQNFGDLIGTLAHGQQNGSSSKTVVLNNHDSLGNTFGPPPRTFIYDDSGQNYPPSQPSDGPGSLNNSVGQQAIGPWILTEVDNSLTQTGAVTSFNLLIEPHQDATKGIRGTVGPLGWWRDYVDVPPGTTSLTISATNLTGTGQLDLYVKFGSIPTLTDTDEFGPAGLTNGTPPGNSITINSPAPGRYWWWGLYNNSVNLQDFYLIAKLDLGAPPQGAYTSSGPVPLLDDAVTTDSLYVPVDTTISTMEVGLRVDHPRVSDLVFHLISPRGTRVLLVENRGGTTTNGMGVTIPVTTIIPVSSSGGAAETTKIISVASASGTLTITYNFYGIPDEMVVKDQGGNQIFDSGVISGSGVFNIAYTNSSTLTIVMNPGGGLIGTGWDYTVNAVQASYTYLVLTEDTNKTTTPIKFAPPPFVPVIPVPTNIAAVGWHSSFEGTQIGQVNAGTVFSEGWHVDNGNIDVIWNGFNNTTAYEANHFIDMNGSAAGTISTNVPTLPGQTYQLSFAYSRNPQGGIPLTAQLLANGIPLLTLAVTTNNSWPNLGWATTSLLYTATSPATTVQFASQTAGQYGVLLDAIDLAPLSGNNGFERAAAGDYAQGHYFDGWFVSANQVTVISNTALAYQGTNLLALADGQISRILPTVPGTKYTLSYAYRGPGAAGFWRGENNADDSINGSVPIAVNNITYTGGEVGRAFMFDGSSSLITMAASAALNVTNATIDAWIYPTNSQYEPIVEYGGAGQLSTLDFWNNGQQLSPTPGCLYGITRPSSLMAYTSGGVVPQNTWSHVAFTLDARNGVALLFYNGVQVASGQMAGPITTASFAPVNIGYRDINSLDVFQGYRFAGLLDEITIYNRALSASEIKAIYDHDSAGKFDTNAPSIASGLAEAQVTLNGISYLPFFGDNTNWQTTTIQFVATTTNTPLQITGIEPGMLLDNFVMSEVTTNNYDLYYLPEQSLDTLAGENARGTWKLEVQDDRVGATNPAPSLLSWQLRYIFTTPVTTIPTLTNGMSLTNTVPPGGIAYYLVLVPTNADIATNILFNTDGLLNLLFDQTTPPAGIIPPDYLILSAPPGSFSSAILTLTSYPTNFAAGGFYYLGVQNPGTVPVNFGIRVDFHLLAPPLNLPQLPELIAYADQLFTVTNSATGGFGPLTYMLTSSAIGNVPVIDLNTAVITWTPTTNQAPAVYTLTNIVTDGTTLLTATDIFHVLVVLTNGLPAFPGAEGAGGFAIGGRGGDVYHVINVNDDGPGSLRYGINSTFGSRTIIFDVSGTINLISELRINKPYFTIAGQTAPGAGIAIQGLTTSVKNTHDMQVRFFRCRPGDIYAPAFQDDSFHFRGVTNSIADHISASWSIDEVLSTTLSTNVTVQWSMIAEPLNHSAHLMDDGSPGFQAHGYGSLIRYGSGAVSYHHNLYADNYSRNPRLGDNIQLDFINNVVCNWGIFAGYNADDSADNPGGFVNYLNYIGNYVIAGSNTTANPNIAFASGVPNAAFAQIYQATNFIDNNAFTNVLNGSDTGWGMFSGPLTQLGSPTPITNGIPVTTNSPAFAYEQVLDFAGASVAGVTAAGTPAVGTSLLRDPVDTNIVTGVRNKSGQIIDFISSNSFAGVYLSTNFGVTYSGYADATTYWTGQGITKFVGVNPWPQLNPAPQPLDSDGDGLPDYWETTLFLTGQTNSMDPAVPNNNHSNPDGYTDLEHYINWLAAPHALTVSNTPVDVDLYAIAGRTGNLTFGVTNGTNGTVTLGGDGHTATFMPTNTYFGFASFGFTVTNLDTSLGGTNLDSGFDVTVSVMVSATNITTSSVLLTNGVPQTNSIPTNSIAYFLVNVPPNAQIATNILWFADAPVNLLFSQVGFPTGTNTGDYTLLAGSTGGISILSTNSMPTNIVPGGSYYLGVQNPNGGPVNFAIEVDFYPPPPTNPPAPPSLIITITSITFTNGGFLLQWQGPTNFQYEIQWTTSFTPVVWNTVLNPVINVFVTATNGHYSFFDDGTLTGGFGPMKFYRVLGGLNLGPITGPGPATNTVLAGTMSQAEVAVPANAISASNLLISATGPLNVWFNQTNPPAGNTNAGDFLMLSATNAGVFVLTSNSVPPLVPGTNYYLGFQNPGTSNVTFVFQVAFGFAPTNAVSNFSVTATNGGIWLKWNGLTNYQYQVQWTTNLAPPTVWNTISNIVLTSTTGIFAFFDDGSLTGGFGPMKFYRLIAWPFMTPIPQTLSISSVTVTNIAGTNDLVLRWSAPTNYQYGIQWTTNITLPFSNWFIIASPVFTVTNSVYTFIDNGQTGPPASMKFFRLLEY